MCRLHSSSYRLLCIPAPIISYHVLILVLVAIRKDEQYVSCGQSLEGIMFVERKKREKLAGGIEHIPGRPGAGRRGLPSAALMPFLAGVVMGLAISTLAVIRPPNSTAAAGSITNIYISLGKPHYSNFESTRNSA